MRTRKTESPLVDVQMTMAQFTELIGKEIFKNLTKSGLTSAGQEKFMKIVDASVQNVMAEKFANQGVVQLTQIPLGSMSASGKFEDKDFGKIVYVPGTSKHKPYQRKWVKPPNPQTPVQQSHRILFKQATQHWTSESQVVKDQWNQYAIKVHEYTGQTSFIKQWFKVLRESGIPPSPGFLT
jgi:hypothetical protein